MTSKVPEGWTAHDGRPCPVDPDSRPDMMFDNGPRFGTWISLAAKSSKRWRAAGADWSKCIAYRPEKTT